VGSDWRVDGDGEMSFEVVSGDVEPIIEERVRVNMKRRNRCFSI
jgi:hypothetical protein